MSLPAHSAARRTCNLNVTRRLFCAATAAHHSTLQHDRAVLYPRRFDLSPYRSCLRTAATAASSNPRSPSTRSLSTASSDIAQTRAPRPPQVFIALGSNEGDRLANLEAACRALQATAGIRLWSTSGLWETEAVGDGAGGRFYNGVCRVQTRMPPLQLLDRLQEIERELGRRSKGDKGPRTLDLDLLLYGNETVEHERLRVPHPLMLEREFVLRPLCELVSRKFSPPVANARSYFARLQHVADTSAPLSTLTPLCPQLPPLTPLKAARRTHIMSIMNLTPDSFSDGGLHAATDTATLLATVQAHQAAGASIVDVGGQSTRPGAGPVTADEEIARILPSIAALKALAGAEQSPANLAPAISVDTYRAAVAEAAVAAGAHIVNDVSAGTLDRAMLPTLARLGCTVVLTHMRGDPSNMSSAAHTAYPDGLVATVARELRQRVQAAEAAGVRRWRIMLDPGIGFAKTQAQNLELLRRLGELRAWPGLQGLPWVVGASRKGFIGSITGVAEPRERAWGTAATVAAAVQGGADIVRVHDVAEMGQVVKMADAIWRV